MNVKEKHHRLPRELYRGGISVAFTLCLKGRKTAFVEPQAVLPFMEMLGSVMANAACIVPVYCFMPDHLHLIISGTRDDSDIWKAINNYKQKTGFWMSQNTPDLKWQKDFYDHIVRKHEDIVTQIKYILDNPLRKGFVSSWEEYLYKGSIGCKLEDILHAII